MVAGTAHDLLDLSFCAIMLPDEDEEYLWVAGASGLPDQYIARVNHDRPVRIERDHEQHRIGRLTLEITLPPAFPEKHREAIVRAADLCSVKKHILHPPAFEVRAVEATAAPTGVPAGAAMP